MGYQFPIKVQLRDDEISLSNLVIDMNAAPLISEFLLDVRDGKIKFEGADIIASTLQKFCYRNEEYDELAEINQQIIEDMNYFKSCLGLFSGARVISTMDRFDNTLQYITGSRTWIEAYQERLTLATSLFMQLQEKGYEFTPDELRTYSERYSSVMKEKEFANKQRELINEQWAKDVHELGIEEADKRKVESLVTCGLMTKEQAEKSVKVGSALEMATGKHEKSSFTEKVSNVASKAVEVINKADQAMFGDEQTGETTACNKVLDSDCLIELCDSVEDMYGTPEYSGAALALHHLLQYVTNRLGLSNTGVTDIDQGTTDNMLLNMFKTFVNTASIPSNRGLIDGEVIEISDDESLKDSYNKVVALTAK